MYYLFISQYPQYLARCSYNRSSVTSRSRLLACICISATERCAISDVNSVFLFFTTQVSSQVSIVFFVVVLNGKVSSFSPEPSLGFQCKRTNPTVIKSNEGTHSDRKQKHQSRGDNGDISGFPQPFVFPCTELWAALDLFIFPECEGNPFVRTLLGSLYSLFLPMLSCLLASLLSVKRP